MFGCTLFEIIYHKYPYPELSPLEAAGSGIQEMTFLQSTSESCREENYSYNSY